LFVIRQVRKEVLHNIDSVNHFSAIRIGDYKLVQGHISDNDNSWYPPPAVFEPQGQRGQDNIQSSWGQGEAEALRIWGSHPRNLEGQGQSEGQGLLKGQGLGGSPLKFIPEKLSTTIDSDSESGDGKYSRLLKQVTHGLSSSSSLSSLSSSASSSSSSSSSLPVHAFKSSTPIVVDCGKRPANASTNCVPEKAPCLFYIPDDPCEFNNVASQHPAIVKQLMDRIEEYRRTMVAPGNKPIDPKGNPALHGGAWEPWL
jgi:hypothetical protein